MVEGAGRIEGYWSADKGRDGLPMPKAGSLKIGKEGKEELLAALEKKEAGARVIQFKGWSNCRVCDCSSGSQEFELNGGRWPQGLSHCIKEHNVAPSEEFMAFVLGKRLRARKEAKGVLRRKGVLK